MAWSRKVPVVPVKGDATETYQILATMTDCPLSFVWLDLDMEPVMEPVRQGIWPLLSKDTIIGVDDYGRPECPGIKPWADTVEKSGQWRKIEEYDWADIAFYQKTA